MYCSFIQNVSLKALKPLLFKGVEQMVKEIKEIYKNDVRLHDVKGVNRLLARVTNMLLKGDIEESRARTIGYLCNIMITGFKAGELEDRITELEESIKKAV